MVKISGRRKPEPIDGKRYVCGGCGYAGTSPSWATLSDGDIAPGTLFEKLPDWVCPGARSQDQFIEANGLSSGIKEDFCMHCVRTVTENLWVGANDHRLALFEHPPHPQGVSQRLSAAGRKEASCLTRWTGPPAASCWRTSNTC